MSILIRGMEVPKHCGVCGIEWCERWKRLIITGMPSAKARPADCPLVSVPPHGRLIDADALMKMCGMATDCYDCPNGEHGWCKRSQDVANICEAIENAPTVIPAEGET